jgi:hypothetical protein
MRWPGPTLGCRSAFVSATWRGTTGGWGRSRAESVPNPVSAGVLSCPPLSLANFARWIEECAIPKACEIALMGFKIRCPYGLEGSSPSFGTR